MILYEMYGDCMLAFRELPRKADRVRRGRNMDDLTTIMTEAQNAIGGDYNQKQPETPA